MISFSAAAPNVIPEHVVPNKLYLKHVLPLMNDTLSSKSVSNMHNDDQCICGRNEGQCLHVV